MQFIERPDAFQGTGRGERSILVNIDYPGVDIVEFETLARSAGTEPVAIIKAASRKPDARFFIGKGKLAELKDVVVNEKVEVVLFNHILSPAQERNLETHLCCAVLDRTGLILDIFAQRARTFEGRLQVELAQLKHLSTRLVRGWTHLERQKGGIGLRGPGETQLETDRRLIRHRITAINKRLSKVRSQRSQGRRSRKRSSVPAISLVGYTNAGKSTLFNQLTDSDIYAADQLFATLDPSIRSLDLDDIGNTVLIDTVGFIQNLPTTLVDAFQATLEETREADLLLHVIDASSMVREEHIQAVNQVLYEIGAEHVPILYVYNKIDDLSGISSHIDCDENGVPKAVWVSALQGEGLNLLKQTLSERLSDKILELSLILRPELGRLRARLYESRTVCSETYNRHGHSILSIRIEENELAALLKNEDVSLHELELQRSLLDEELDATYNPSI